LQLRSKSPKRRVKAQRREDRSAPSAANRVWAMDFVHDQLFDGRKIRVLTIVDSFRRLSPAIDVRQSYRRGDVVETLERVIREIGCPKTIRLDNGPEFVSRELDLSIYRSMGFHARRHARPQPARQTGRQRIHRKPERQAPRRMSECAPVPQPRRGAAKMRGLA
jgi:putative transposase